MKCRAICTAVCWICLTTHCLELLAQNPQSPDGLLLSGHLSDVSAAEFTPDGRSVITASIDETACMWDSQTGAVQQVFRGHQGPLYCLAVSADGSLLATGSQDNTVRLWDIPRKTAIKSLPMHEGAAESLALSADGLSAVSVGRDQQVRHITLATGQTSARAGHWSPVIRAAYRSDNAMFATADESGLVVLWSPYLDAPQAKLGAHLGAVTGLYFHPNNQQLLTSGEDGTFRLWQLPTAQRTFHGSTDAVRALALVNGQFAITAGADRLVRVVDFNTAQQVREMSGHEASISALAVANNQAFVASGDDAGNIRVWQIGDGVLVSQAMAHSGGIRSLAFHPDSQRLLSSGADGNVRIWQIGQMLVGGLELNGPHPGGVSSAIFSPNGEQILTGAADNNLHVWNTTDGAKVRTFAGHSGPITCVAFSPDSAKVFAGSTDKTVRVWNANDGTLTATWEQAAAVNSISIANDGQRAVVGTDDHRVHVWDVVNHQHLEWVPGHNGPVFGVRMAPDNRTILSVSADKTLKVAQSAAVRATQAHAGRIGDMVLLNGGGQMVTCGADDLVKMWDVGSGQFIRDFSGASGINSLAIRNDNQRLAGGNADGEVHLWNAGGSEHLAEWKLEAPVRALAFSPDNLKLAAADERGGILVLGPSMPPVTAEFVEHQRFTSAAAPTRIVFTADSRFLYGSDTSGQLQQWAYASPTPMRQFNHGGAVFGVTISSDGSLVTSCSADQTVRIFDVKTGGQRAQLNGHQGAVYGLAVSPDGALLVSAGSDRSLRLWDVLGGRQLKQLASTEETMYSVAIHPGAAIVAAGGGDRKVHWFDLLNGTLQRSVEGHTDFVQSVTFNPQGTRLLSYGYAGNLYVWNASDGAQLYKTRIGRVGNTARYNFDGSRVVLATGDGLARVIDLPAEAR